MAVIPRRIGADAGEFQTHRSASAKATCGGYLGAADVSVTCYPLLPVFVVVTVLQRSPHTEEHNYVPIHTWRQRTNHGRLSE